MNNEFVLIPPDTRPRFQLCLVSGNDGACDEIAFWWCHPGGSRDIKIPMCDQHKQAADVVIDETQQEGDG
jgi:hypothetical protein